MIIIIIGFMIVIMVIAKVRCGGISLVGVRGFVKFEVRVEIVC